MTVSTLLAAATSSSSPPHNWGWVLAVIGAGGALVLLLLFRFYKALQNSDFISNLLGIPTKENPTRQTPSSGAYRFAEEFLARRTEFWLLYAQVFVAVFFIAAIAALLLVGVVEVNAGLPALSTVVGIVLGKTLLSAKGTPLGAQEQIAGRTPSNVKAPVVTADPAGDVKADTVLTAEPGEWSGLLPMTYAYTWRRKGAGGEAPIPNESSSTYKVTAEDVGKSISVMVSASNSSGSATAASAPTAVVE